MAALATHAAATALLAALAVPVDVMSAVSWVEHRDAAGFTLHKPTDWRVQSSHAADIVVSAPHGNAAALVRARSVPPRVELTQWLRQHYAATEPGLHNVRMLKVESSSQHVAHAAFNYGSEVFQGRASVVALCHRGMATVFVAAAARAQFAQALPALSRILDSLRFGAAEQRWLAGDLTRLLRIGTDLPDL